MRHLPVVLALMLLGGCATGPLAPGALPVVELGALGTESSRFALFLTGDGGWRKIDVQVAHRLRTAGIPVVGLLSNRYFASEKSPAQAAADLDRLIVQYAAKWKKSGVILVGYSRGADALPVVVSELPASTRRMIAAVAILGPSLNAALSLHGPDRYPLAPRLATMEDLPLICVYGTREKESLCREIPPERATIVAIPGGHHFGGDYDRIARAILEAVKGQ